MDIPGATQDWMGHLHEVYPWIDVVQTFAIIVVALAQIYTMLILRAELRRTAAVSRAMGQAMGEQGDVRRRLDEMEDLLADLLMRVDQTAPE
jgi:hypothetical protein